MKRVAAYASSCRPFLVMRWRLRIKQTCVGRSMVSPIRIAQTGLTLLLRKAHKLGAQARAGGRSPAAGDAEKCESTVQHGVAADGAAAADAHMAELLAELQAEAHAGWVL